MSDSEIMTLAIMMDYLPFPGETQYTGRNTERLLNKSVIGFATHMAAKITSHTLRLLLRRQFGIDIQTFQAVTPC